MKMEEETPTQKSTCKELESSHMYQRDEVNSELRRPSDQH